MNAKPFPFQIDETPKTLWGHLRSTVRDTVLPYQWKALNDELPGVEPSHALQNFRIAAGLAMGEFHGMVFQDSDVGKWIEAVSYSLRTKPSAELEALVDETVELLARAQAADGYLNTYFLVKEPGRRWTNLRECHELYCAGHLLEGALAYYEATGKRRFLDVMLRYIDLIAATFGRGPGQLRGYDGHEEIELALMKLFDFTGDVRHRELARYFLEERGQEPSFFAREAEALGSVSHWSGLKAGFDPRYYQSHLPIRQQEVAVGHAVRAVYLYTAMAQLADPATDPDLWESCLQLWNNLTTRQMYVTGGIGSTNIGEAVTLDYDLPNDVAYSETCAAIGLIFFARRLLEKRPRGDVADIMEQAFFNTVLASMSADGRSFFYANPLEVVPELSRENPTRHHVKSVRQGWFSCACCPPNLARLILSFGDYVFTQKEDTVYLHQYVPGSSRLVAPGLEAQLVIETRYPFSGKISLSLEGQIPSGFSLGLRRPSWCRQLSLSLNGQSLEGLAEHQGYLFVNGPWRQSNGLELSFDLEPQFLEAHPLVRSCAGKVAIRRGPVVYCLEQVDNGPNLSDVEVDTEAGIAVENAAGCGLPLPAATLRVQGWRSTPVEPVTELYHPVGQRIGHPVTVTAVPYFLWGNRGEGEMTVWVRRSSRSSDSERRVLEPVEPRG